MLIEDHQQRACFDMSQPVLVRSLVTEAHRLSVYGQGDWGELYDLRADPMEVENLWDAAQAKDLKSALLHRLVQLGMEHSESSPRPTQAA